MPEQAFEGPDFTEYTISIPGGPVQFRGALLAAATSRRDGQPQWTELDLYLLEQPRRSRYCVVTAGMSVVYHSAAGRCNAGKAMTLGELTGDQWEDLVPCPRCRPDDLLQMPDEHEVRAEVPLLSIMMARTPADLVRRLRWSGPGHGRPRTSVPMLSRVSQALLDEASDYDDGIAEELARVRVLADEEDTNEDEGLARAGLPG
jgi:hypothetical protein